MRTLKIICMVLVVSLLTYGSGFAWEDEQQDEDQAAVGTTPPRLSFVNGQVSYWRSGASDWAEANVNTPLAAGDQLYAGSPGNLELQIDSRTFVRAAKDTQIGIENLETELTQFKVTEGHASLDIHRDSDTGRAVEIDTPNATFLIEDPGYYKVHVNGENITFSVYWSGRATVTPAEGEAFVVSSDEEVRLQGTERPRISTSRASELDRWDQWCLARSDDNLNSASSRYLSSDIYGASDLDKAGEWQETSEYGPVWLPTDTPDGWAPYTNGTWINDPVYGWTWVDNEPWGWAPYHYGRWISLNGRWAWAPGPPVRRPAYAPALVAFFGDQERAGSGSDPSVGWVPLGWGEPLVPWWGSERSHRPWWGGWGGPRVRNVERTGNYRNLGVHNAMVVVHKNRFGHVPIRSARVSGIDPRGFRPMPAAPIVSRSSAGLMPVERRGIRPPDTIVERPVVSTRLPRRHIEATSPGKQFLGPTGRVLPPPRIVNAPKPETIQRRIEVKQPLLNEQPSQQFHPREERIISQPPRNEIKVQQQQQIHQQQVQEQQLHQQQMQQQQIQQQQQIKEQQIHQQQIQQQQIQQQQQIKEQQIHQQQIQQQQIQQQQIKQQQIQQQQQIKEQQIHQQQIKEQQIRQQQIHQQQVQQQQQQQQIHQQQVQQQQQQQIQQQQQQQQKGPGPQMPVKKKGGPQQQEEEQKVIIRMQ
jgi:hypothetical protein